MKITSTRYMSSRQILGAAAICPSHNFTGDSYMSDWLDYENEDESLETFELDILCHMDDPPAEAYEMSWLRARDILESAGPGAAILLLTVTTEGEDLASSVVLSSGYERIPTGTIFEILNTHMGVMGTGQEPLDSQDGF